MKNKEKDISISNQGVPPTIPLTGKYSKRGNKLKKAELALLICTRKNPTKKKAVQYLLAFYSNTTNYISSLYVTDTTGNFQFEYQGERYSLTISNVDAVVNLT